MRLRRVFLACAAVVAGIICGGVFCVAQEEPAPTPDLPAALWVKDRFARAAKNQSSAPSYLMATIVNDTTGETKRVCIEGVQLFNGVRLQNNLGRGWGGRPEDREKAMRLILGNPTRTYHFTNPDAWQAVQPRYSPQMLAKVQEEFRTISTAELAQRFDEKGTGGLIRMDNKPAAEVFGYCEAAAYVLTSRGLLAGRGDFGNSLYVITPQMLADEDKRKQGYAEETRRSEAEGFQFAAKLPGYAALTRQFSIKSPEVGSYWLGTSVSKVHAFTARLNAKPPCLINSVDWLNPVSKAQQARYDWFQFLLTATHIEHLARLHPWLQEWKKVGPNRIIEAKIYGRNLHDERDEDVQRNIVLPWKEAGLRGKPYCELILRWQEPVDGEDCWAVVYLPLPGSGEIRSLIARVRVPEKPSKNRSSPPAHWLDALSLHSYDASSSARQCAVVTPSGDWKLLTLPTRAPIKPLLSKEPKP